MTGKEWVMGRAHLPLQNVGNFGEEGNGTALSSNGERVESKDFWKMTSF